MADYYVNKGSGDDSNTGADDNNAFATWQKANDSASSGDTVYVRYAEFTEEVALNTAGVTYVCDYGTKLTCGTSSYPVLAANITIYNCHLVVSYALGSGAGDNLGLYNCILEFAYNAQGYCRHYGDNLVFNGCIFLNTDSYLYIIGGNGSQTFENCLSLSTGSFFRSLVSGDVVTIINTVMTGKLWHTGTGSTFSFVNCDILGALQLNNVSYADYAAAVAAVPQFFQSCFDKEPYLDNNDCPEPGSPLIGNGAGGSYENYIGARQPGVYHSANGDLFAGASYAVGGWNETNQRYEPDAGESVLEIETDVQDAGASVAIGPAYKDAVEVYPTDMLRVENDVPNQLDYQMRYSDTSFAKADATPAWASYQWGEDPGVSGRYKQYRFYLRTDGVEQ